MAVLLQAYAGASDAEAVELTVVDLRWQLVLDRLGSDEPAFSQGALHDLRARLIRTDMDRRLLERTVQFARASGGFDPKKLPKDLGVAMPCASRTGATERPSGTLVAALHIRGTIKEIDGCLAVA